MVDNTANHSGAFSIFSQTSTKINEAGLGVTLDFTTNAESVDLSTKAGNNKNLFSGANTALSTLIFQNATQPYTGAQARAWGSALTLIAIAFILMIVARLITARFARYDR